MTERDDLARLIGGFMAIRFDTCNEGTRQWLLDCADTVAHTMVVAGWLLPAEAAVLRQQRDAARAAEFERGVRQAVTWLRADYPYGTGPDWRENGAEWIADRLAEHTAVLAAGSDAGEGS